MPQRLGALPSSAFYGVPRPGRAPTVRTCRAAVAFDADFGECLSPRGELVTAHTSLSDQAGPSDLGDGDDGSASNAKRRRRLRLGPVLPARLRPLTRPKLWVDAVLIGISYRLYQLTQISAPRHRVAATQRGLNILRWEAFLHIDFEHWLNHAVNSVGWLVVAMNYYYATLHFIVPVVVLVWVYRAFPDRYRAIRTALFAMTVLALIGFYFYALCPPRLLYAGDPSNPHAFIDTFYAHRTWGNKTSEGIAGISSPDVNVYAAMPSLHIGWSVWCAFTIAHLAKRKWVKILGILYPCTNAT